MWKLVAAIWAALGAAAIAGPLPNLAKTPGVARTDLTQRQLCTTKWGREHRAVTAAMKRQVFLLYGYVRLNKDPRCPCEIDHLISRELGGADDVSNLWPQSYRGAWNAHDKDRLENKLHALVCGGELTVSEGQGEIVRDWVASYMRRVGARNR